MSSRIIVIFGVICALSFVAGIWTSDGLTAAAPGTDEDLWSLPGDEVLAPVDADAFLATSRAIRWSGSREAGTEEGEEQGSTWRLLAIIGDPAPVAVVETADRLVRMREGDALPSGERLTSIENGAVVIARDGCETRWRLYRSAPDTVGACQTNAAGNSEQ